MAGPEEEPPATLGWKLGLAGLGVGGLTFLAGVATGLSALDRSSDLAARCPTKTTCPSDQQPVIDSMKLLSRASTATLILGGALTTVGAVLYFTSPRGRIRPGAKTGAVLKPMNGGGWIGLQGEL